MAWVAADNNSITQTTEEISNYGYGIYLFYFAGTVSNFAIFLPLLWG